MPFNGLDLAGAQAAGPSLVPQPQPPILSSSPHIHLCNQRQSATGLYAKQCCVTYLTVCVCSRYHQGMYLAVHTCALNLCCGRPNAMLVPHLGCIHTLLAQSKAATTGQQVNKTTGNLHRGLAHIHQACYKGIDCQAESTSRGGDGQGVPASSSNVRDCYVFQSYHTARAGSIHRGAITQLAKIVDAPSNYLPFPALAFSALLL